MANQPVIRKALENGWFVITVNDSMHNINRFQTWLFKNIFKMRIKSHEDNWRLPETKTVNNLPALAKCFLKMNHFRPFFGLNQVLSSDVYRNIPQKCEQSHKATVVLSYKVFRLKGSYYIRCGLSVATCTGVCIHVRRKKQICKEQTSSCASGFYLRAIRSQRSVSQ